ncbi:MAG: FAD:protein FMN transferase [Burkholderiales bacterium]|nr:FAD:protein FMN transferase [Burkholderiales bacterium]
MRRPPPLPLPSELPATAAVPAAGSWLQCEEAIMGTAIQVDLWADTATQAQDAVNAVMAEMHRIDRAMSPHRPDSELSRINRDAAHTAVPLSPEMERLIEHALAFSEMSDGAFDISYAAAGQLYDYRAGVAPDASTLRTACALVNHRQLLLDQQAGTLRFGQPGMRIDLGGFAKGHAVDRACRILQRLGIRHAMVAAGGDSRLLGDKRGRPWNMAIRDPRRPGEVVAVLPLQDVSVSTSGDYERYFERDGVRHHHVLNPRTGESPRSLHSVTILAEDGLTSEALSKTVFVLGLHRGMALIESLPGVDAVVVDAEGALHFSSGLSGHGV